MASEALPAGGTAVASNLAVFFEPGGPRKMRSPSASTRAAVSRSPLT